MNTATRRILGEAAVADLERAGRRVDITARFQKWRNDPEGFVDHHFGERSWAAQRTAWEELYRHRKLAWRSGRKTGKSRWLAHLVTHFMCTRAGIVLALGPSRDQIRDVMWANIGELHATAASRGCPLPGTVDATQWRLGPKHFAIGRSTDDPTRIHGFHGSSPVPKDPDAQVDEEDLDRIIEEMNDEGVAGGSLLVIADEIVADPILRAILGSIQGPNCYMVLCFNPMLDASADHTCARAFSSVGAWRRMSVHPYPVDDPVGSDVRYSEIPSWLQRPSWRDTCAREWGRSSPMYRAHVEGLFAGEASDRQLISEALLISADQREVYADVGVHIGVDLSQSEGGDECVASRWAYGVKTAEHTWRSSDGMRSAEIVAALRVEWGESDELGVVRPIPSSHVHVDATGLGGPIASRLRQIGCHGIDAVDFGAPPTYDWPELVGSETEFLNRRAELHWTYRRALEEGVARLPRKYAQSWRQAMWPRWDPRVRSGRTVIGIEPKADIVSRHGRSPDHLDADLLAWARTGGGIRITRIR